MLNGTMYVNTSYTVPKLASYTVSYNANGGSGAPSAQTKWHGKSLTLSSTKPTRTGYSFQGWALTKDDADDGTWYYAAGGTCGKNENLTLYAVWEANTYAVTYNANGGSGAPASQTKTYGVTLKLSSTKPTRTNYNFLGWATTASAPNATYSAGGNYTANSAVTLYAVWELAYVKPRITAFSVYRCDSNGNVSDTGANARIAFSYACDVPMTEVLVEWESATAGSDSEIIETGDGSKTAGVVDWMVGNNALSTDATYTLKVTVRDENDESSAIVTINGTSFIIDILAEGKGIAFNKPAELEGVMDIGFMTRLAGGLLYVLLPAETNLDECHTPGFYVGENVSDYSYTNCPLTSGTFTLEIISMGDNGQLMQRLTQCHISSPIVYERVYYKSAGWGEWFGGWIYPNIESEFAVYASDGVSSRPCCRKDGRVVEVRGIVKPAVDIAGGTEMHTIITVPVGYRPNSPIYTICQGSGNCTWLLRVNTNGTVDFSRYRNGDATTTASVGAWLPFQVTYLV